MRAECIRSPRIVVALAVAAIVGGAAVLAGSSAAWDRGEHPRVLAIKDEAQTPAQVAAELMKPGPLPELVLGREDAPVTIVEYADATCPHCASFHGKVLPLVKQRYIDTGKARLVFREFPLNVLSVVAFMSVRCAAPQDAFPLLAALFAHQDDWVRSRSMKVLADKLFAYGRQAGLSREAFDACVPSGESLSTDRQKQLFKDISAVGERAANAFGVSSTPTFFVNGAKLRGAAIEDFDKAIAAATGQ